MNRLATLIALIALTHKASALRTNITRFGENRASCSSFEFKCKSGECVSSESLCDGLVNCQDGSDETSEECSGSNSPFCNPRTFRCDYGACIDGEAYCDGNNDCADDSDEDPVRCATTGDKTGHLNDTIHQATCRSDQFRCNNGQCIRSLDVCDGNINCSDRSDETFTACGSFTCPEYAFRCTYGACIDNDFKCNGEVNCADGSDEDRRLCSQFITTRRPDRPNHTTKKPVSKPQLVRQLCDVPEQPGHGRWRLEKSQCQSSQECKVPHGVTQLDPGTQLVYKCSSGYRLNGTEFVFCGLNGKWSAIPKCQQIRCPPLNSASREATCTYEDNWVSCDNPVLPRTVAQLACRNSYTQDATDLTSRDSVKCNSNGEWEPKPITCVSVCGISSRSTGVPLIVNGSLANVNEFPWHGTLYRLDTNDPSDEKKFICGATIIKENLLVTAAHCVYDEVQQKVQNASRFYVATGNVYRPYDYQGHNASVVKTTRVKKIFVVCNYLGLEGNYASDIAILQVEQPFKFSSTTMPICLDRTSTTDQAALEVGNYGRVAGFGRTAEGSSSFILQYLTVPYVSLNACKTSSVASDSEKYITIDKFCAGHSNGSSVCDGDSGGGLVFQTDNKWYLRGIVSVGIGSSVVGAERTCNTFTYSLYTRVASHMEWIQNVILYLDTNKNFPVCS